MKSGNLSPIDTYTNDWNTALGNGTIACWQAGLGEPTSPQQPGLRRQMEGLPDAAMDRRRQTQRQLRRIGVSVMKATEIPRKPPCSMLAERRSRGDAGPHQSDKAGLFRLRSPPWRTQNVGRHL